MRKLMAIALLFVGLIGAVLPLNAIHSSSTAYAADCSQMQQDGPWDFPSTHTFKGLTQVIMEAWYGGNTKEIGVVIPKFPSRFTTRVNNIMGIGYQEPASCNVSLTNLVGQALYTEKVRHNTWKMTFVFYVPQHRLVLAGVAGKVGNYKAAGRQFLSHVDGHHNDAISVNVIVKM